MTTDKVQDAGAIECRSSSDCPEAEVCDTTLAECILRSAARCPAGTDAECAPFDSLPLCSEQRCSERECSQDKDCSTLSETAICERIRCVDPRWGCVGDFDERPSSSEEGTYQVVVIDSAGGAIPPDLRVELCGSFNDRACTSAPAGAAIRIEAETNSVFVEHLPPDATVHLQLHAEGFFDAELFSQRTVRGVTVEPVAVLLLRRDFFVNLEAATDIHADSERNATLMARLFDCTDDRAPGLKLTTSRFQVGPRGIETRVFYISEGTRPDLANVETNNFGAAGIVNLAGDKQTTLSAGLGRRQVLSQVLVPKAGWISYVHFFPRVYRQ